LTFKLDVDIFKTNRHAKHLVKRHLVQNLLSAQNRHTHNGLIALSGPLSVQ